MTERPRVILDHVTPSYAIGMWKRLLIWVVEGHTPLPTLEALRLRLTALSRERGDEKHIALTILYPSDSTMSTEERRSVARMIEESKHRRLASSTAVLAQGLMGAVHRSILTGMSLVVPPPHPNRITATTDDAIAFLLPYITQSSGPASLADVRAMVNDLYAALKERKQQSRP